MNNLRELRIAKGLTQYDLAKELRKVDPRIDVSMVSRFEQGVCLPTKAVLEHLERYLQIDMNEVFDEMVLLTAEQEKIALNKDLINLAVLIPFGKDNAVSRESLKSLLRCSDRHLRRQIEELRQCGVIISNDQDGNGYYQPVEVADMVDQYKRNNNRAMSILRQQKPLKDRIIALGGTI